MAIVSKKSRKRESFIHLTIPQTFSEVRASCEAWWINDEWCPLGVPNLLSHTGK